MAPARRIHMRSSTISIFAGRFNHELLYDDCAITGDDESCFYGAAARPQVPRELEQLHSFGHLYPSLKRLSMRGSLSRPWRPVESRRASEASEWFCLDSEPD